MKSYLLASGIKDYTITCDAWTSCAGDCFVAITAHGMKANMTRVGRLLDVLPVPESHTIDNMKQRILDVLDYYEITSKVCLGIADNAANERGAILACGFQWENCVVHTLDLTLKHASNTAEASLGTARELATKVITTKMNQSLKRCPM